MAPRAPSVPTDRLPQIAQWLGVSILVLLLEEFVGGPGDPLLIPPGVKNVAVVAGTAPFALTLVYVGHWIERDDLGDERYGRIGAWCIAGLVSFVALNVVVMVANPPDGVRSTFGWLRFAVAIGAAGGLVIGAIEARTIDRGRRAERNAVRAQMAEERNEWLDYVNSLLRHEVLNTTQIVEGNVSIVLEDHETDEEVRERLLTVREQSRRVTTVVDDLRSILEANRDVDLEAVDLSAMLVDEVANLRDVHDDVDVTTAIPDGVTVEADALLRRVFANLLANAVEHHDGDAPQISVTVESGPDAVTVVVSDDGPGIPDEQVSDLFDRSVGKRPNHGSGLYLVGRLVERYDGTIEIVGTGPDGSTFAVRLPPAGAPSDSSSLPRASQSPDG